MNTDPNPVSLQSAAENYSSRWSRYKLLRDVTLLVLFGGGLLDLFFPPIFAAITKTQDDSRISFLYFIVWGFACVLAGNRLMTWKCPRCGEVFSGGAKAMDRFSTWFNWIFLPKRCVSCGLPKFAVSPDADDLPASR